MLCGDVQVEETTLLEERLQSARLKCAKNKMEFWSLSLANSFIGSICYFELNKILRKKMNALWGCTGGRDNMA